MLDLATRAGEKAAAPENIASMAQKRRTNFENMFF
jgi:hypothetical protein